MAVPGDGAEDARPVHDPDRGPLRVREVLVAERPEGHLRVALDQSGGIAAALAQQPVDLVDRRGDAPRLRREALARHLAVRLTHVQGSRTGDGAFDRRATRGREHRSVARPDDRPGEVVTPTDVRVVAPVTEADRDVDDDPVRVGVGVPEVVDSAVHFGIGVGVVGRVADREPAVRATVDAEELA